MCGIWTALEDISENAGPLVYYPRSHRFPYFSSKDLNLTLEQIDSNSHPQAFFHDVWRKLLIKSGYKREQFIAKKGDVLIWHSNLLHGGDSIVDLDLSRRSQVSHYYFRDCEYKRPFWDCLDSSERKWFKPNDLTLIK